MNNILKGLEERLNISSSVGNLSYYKQKNLACDFIICMYEDLKLEFGKRKLIAEYLPTDEFLKTAQLSGLSLHEAINLLSTN